MRSCSLDYSYGGVGTDSVKDDCGPKNLAYTVQPTTNDVARPVLLIRPLHLTFEPMSQEHIDGLNAHLDAHLPSITRGYDDNDGCHLLSVSTTQVAIADRSPQELAELVFEKIRDLDNTVEQSVCEVSAAFMLPFRIYGILTQPFYGVMTAEEAKRAPMWEKSEVPFHPEISRSVDTRQAAALLKSRPEAARLLAAVVCADKPTATLLACVRLFEAAFKKGGVDLKEPLAKFLHGAKLGYTETESDRWIDSRHRVVHADRIGRALYDGDVYSQIPRIKQAAMDVVFNKRDWRSKNTERVEPTKLGTRFNGRHMELTVGVFTTFRPITTDYFGRYPINSKNSVRAEMDKLLPSLEAIHGHRFDGGITVNGYVSRDVLVANKG